ncbi:MAG: GAF domain-containing protein [Acidobacteriota bacterium]|jgi:HD-GYP domain-containing protein (c-di-GMP phosphodiesterase class II)
MSTAVSLTPGVRGAVAAEMQLVDPGCASPGPVLLTTASELGAWRGDELAETLVVCLGRGSREGPAPFLELPENASPTLVGVALEAAVRAAKLALGVRSRHRELVGLGVALAAERNLTTLLERILGTARQLGRADAGSLYLIEERADARVLRFAVAQNASVPAFAAAAPLPLDSSSLAGHVALSGETVNLADVRQLPGDTPFRFNPAFDQASGYHTRSLLAVPMVTRGGEVVGVIQLINRRHREGPPITSPEAADDMVIPFDAEDVELVSALAAHAAVAIENARLVEEVERLFEGFVRASVRAIEQRDPTTSGHSQRVAAYTVGLARALERHPPPAYRGVRFSPHELTQLRYAGLLHDFGKVGVREAVLTKAKKLTPDRLAVVLERFRHALRAREVEVLRTLLARLVQGGSAPSEEAIREADEAIARIAQEMDGALLAVLSANEPLVLQGQPRADLASLASMTFPGTDGERLPLLMPEELRALAVNKGSLDEEERREIESHVVHSYQFLITIPWPRRFARIPEIAYGHHELLNGRGYPRRLSAPEVPLEARMMTVCDIYDALAAGDRPYKRALPPERALDILTEEVRAGALDGDLVEVFIAARVYSRASASEPW